MSRYLNAVSQATSTVRVQRWTIGVLGLVALVAIFNAKFKDTQLTAHIPPDLSNGAALKIGGKPEVPPPNVYAFGFYMWQQVNNWTTDGAQDYGKQIYALQHYITPACREQLKADLKIKGGNGELVTRTRAMMEIPGQGFAANRVTNHGNGSWTVLLDLALIETSRGLRVKEAFIRYPLRVVRYDATRENNPWGLAIDCFGDRHPERIERSEAKPVEPAPAPSTAVPSILPQPVDPLPSAPNPAEPTGTPPTPPTAPAPAPAPAVPAVPAAPPAPKS